LKKAVVNMKKLLVIFIAVWLLFAQNVYAHTNNSSGFSTIKMEGETVRYELQLDLLELNRVVDLRINPIHPPKNRDLGRVLERSKGKLQTYVNEKIKLYADGIPLKGQVKSVGATTVQGRTYAVVIIDYEMESPSANLTVNYGVFFDDNDPSHVNYVKISMDGKQREFVFSSSTREYHTGEATFLQKAKQFLLLGLEHIFTGYDHILFVISLLFGAMTIRRLLSLITAFTVAHSVTLALATLEIIHLPAKLVESAIALSIVYVALQNIFTPDSRHRSWIAFGFGLIHGFGFAGILSEIRLDQGDMVTSLLFFNAGIELGQIVIVSLTFPMLMFIQKRFSPKWLVPVASTGILAIALVWFFQRAFPWEV
jgi:hydrogenase/urease accessory protein HupE